MWLIIISLLVVIGIVLYIISFYNSVVNLKIEIENTHKQIELTMKKRFDLINQLVNAVKAHMKFERKVMVKITKLRNMPLNTMNDINRADDLAKSLVKEIVVAVENYPKLRTVERVKELVLSIKNTEAEIARLRYVYNNKIKKLSTKLTMFPNNVLADTLGMNKEKFLKFQKETEDQSQFK